MATPGARIAPINPWARHRPEDPWRRLARRLRGAAAAAAARPERLWGLAFAAVAAGLAGWGAAWAWRLALALADGAPALVPAGALALALAAGAWAAEVAAGLLAPRLGRHRRRALAVAVAGGAVLLGMGPVALGTLIALSPGLALALGLAGGAALAAAVAWRRAFPPQTPAAAPRRAGRRRTVADPGGGPDPRWLACLQLAGVRPATATALHRAGFRTLEALARADDVALLAVRGVGPATLRRLRAAVSARIALEQAARRTDAA